MIRPTAWTSELASISGATGIANKAAKEAHQHG